LRVFTVHLDGSFGFPALWLLIETMAGVPAAA
jgi:hypothetical protein